MFFNLKDYIIYVYNNEYINFLNKSNVLSIALGYKYINYIQTNEL